MSILDQPVSINGAMTVLIADYVGDNSAVERPLLLEAAHRGVPDIWVNEAAATAARATNPEANLHGFWQTLLASKAINLDKALTIYRTAPRSGLFLYCENGAPVQSGLISANRLPNDMPDYLKEVMRDSSYDEIDPDAVRLVEPATAVVLPADIMAARQRRQRLTNGVSIAGACVAVVLAIGYNNVLSHIAERKRLQLATLDQSITAGQANIAELSRRKRPELSVHLGEIQTIAYVLDLAAAGEIKSISQGSGTGSAFLATVKGLEYTPSWAQSVKMLPSGSYSVAYGSVRPRDE
jgi:hypothetical protein